jgi:hypothetical protein
MLGASLVLFAQRVDCIENRRQHDGDDEVEDQQGERGKAGTAMKVYAV